MSSTHKALPLRTTIQKALGTTSSTERHQCVSECESSRLWRLCWSGLSRLCVDAWTVMSAHGLRLWSVKSGYEVWDRVELRQLEQSPEGELGKWPQNLPREDSERDRDRGQPWLQHVISGCILMLFLCASLLYVITKIILCLCECVRVCSIKHRKH